MVDSFGRTINYLRLSVTDRCNLRCLYCMPAEGVSWVSHNDVLRFEEILGICRVLAGLGIKAVRITGGEPLVRRGVTDFIRELKAIKGISCVSMTSNGVLLGEYLEALVDAGLDRVNISLDTLDEKKFCTLTRANTLENMNTLKCIYGFGNILPAIDKALNLGLDVKINCVPLRGFNEDDIVKIAALAKDKHITVRFIELMPFGPAAVLQPLPISETVSLIKKSFGSLKPVSAKPECSRLLPPGHGPASYYTLHGFTGYIGFISASHNFCKSCNRLRLTSGGNLKSCLFGDDGLDLRALVRGGASNEEIARAIRELVVRKPALHNLGSGNCNKEMFRIGG